jgi:hypothetical protein
MAAKTKCPLATCTTQGTIPGLKNHLRRTHHLSGLQLQDAVAQLSGTPTLDAEPRLSLGEMEAALPPIPETARRLRRAIEASSAGYASGHFFDMNEGHEISAKFFEVDAANFSVFGKEYSGCEFTTRISDMVDLFIEGE